ncbi:cytochrome b/b6 domain-containing protein [Vitreimonas sp.]|uniref:cytochrome b/b6 domain-containing protein n=1 Tax=Vitreimonas sp. TaxID=3069702 RepID=UPI002EDA599D
MQERLVRVWDLPTRVFHWALVALLAVSWFSGGEEGGAATLHRYAGEAIAGLIVFRILWGFIGNERARFADFAAGPGAIIQHLGDLFRDQPKRHLGHNPLGGVAIFALLAIVSALVITGLFSGGDEMAGPFVGMGGLNMAELHEALFRVLQALVVLHLIGVALESWLSRDRLVPAMISGAKRRRPDEPGADARAAHPVALIVALALAATTTFALAAQPIPTDYVGAEAEHGGAHEGGERGEEED